MNVRIELYKADGDKDFLSDVLSLVYLCFLGLWVFTCFKNQPYVHKIHKLMGAFLVMVTLDLICGPADKKCLKATHTVDGWDVVFYAFKFIRGVLFFTVIILIGAGWSLLRPVMQAKEKMVLMIVILLNVAFIVLRDTNPFHKDRRTWGSHVIMVEMIPMGSLLFPILGTDRWKTARTFEKIKEFTWLDEVLIYLSFYYFSWRMALSIVDTAPDHMYSNVIYNGTDEIFSLVFCMVLFYMFRPVEKNEYYFLDIEFEEAVEKNQTHTVHGQKTKNLHQRGRKNHDQVSFTYPKLPEDFEW